MGEAKRNGEKAIRTISQAIGIETPGGRIQVGCDAKSTATPLVGWRSSLNF
ncbi:MAG: hypothetical protein Q7J38_07315 [Gallionella sp.]|nr:hypothetical protein [Gallionella sp.]